MGMSARVGKTGSPAVRDLLREAVERLSSAGVDSPTLDAELMLARAVDTSRTVLLTHPEAVPDDGPLAQFAEFVRLRAKRMPLAYILGRKEFHGIDFEVAPAVLIPRPETEILVDAALEVLRETSGPTLADLGVGSGAIAVSLAVCLPDAHVFGTESSSAALELAGRNVERHGVGDRVELRLGDLFDPLRGLSFHAIVSNPPYIPTAEIPTLQPEIARYEPRGALDGGPDGLDYYRRIVPDALAFLRPSGVLLVEVGAGQSPEVCSLFRGQGYTGVQAVRDYSGIERVVIGRKPATC